MPFYPKVNGAGGGGSGTVTAVTGTAPIVSSGGTAPAISIAKATSSVNGYLASADFAIFAAKQNTVLPTSNEVVYVSSLNGNDTSGDGSYANPYATVAHAMGTIVDASQSKPYAIQLLSRYQVETASISMKPWTYICGLGQRASYIRINGGGTLSPDTSYGTSAGWSGLFNLYWGGSTNINWNLHALGGSNSVFVIQNCTITGNFTYLGRSGGAGDYLEVYTGVTTGTWLLDSVNSQVQSMEMGGTVTVTDTQAVSPGASFNNVTFDQAVSLTGGGTYNFNNIAYSTNGTLTTSGTLTINSYRGLPPASKKTLSGGTTVTNLDDATILPYTPAVSGNWANQPTSVQTALDELAAPVEYNAGSSGSAITINWNNGAAQAVTLTANCTISFSNILAGGSYVLRVKTGAGSFTASFSGVNWGNPGAPTITTAPSSADLINLYGADGTHVIATCVQGFPA